VEKRLGILLLLFSLFYRISLFKKDIIEGFLKESMLEEETMWQKLPL